MLNYARKSFKGDHRETHTLRSRSAQTSSGDPDGSKKREINGNSVTSTYGKDLYNLGKK
jgi:hypothetical protein